jgi:hypothetical protein
MCGCAGLGEKECNAMHDRENTYGEKAIAALDRCAKESVASAECKNAMAVIEKYTGLASKSRRCSSDNSLTGNLLRSQLQLDVVNDKMNELEKRAKKEQKQLRYAAKSNKYYL